MDIILTHYKMLFFFQITEGKVEVRLVRGDHVTMLENIEIAMAINREPLKEN